MGHASLRGTDGFLWEIQSGSGPDSFSRPLLQAGGKRIMVWTQNWRAPVRLPHFQSMLQFSLFGFRINIHWVFWLSTAMLGAGFLQIGGALGLQLTAAWFLIVLVSIILHELGHAFAFRRFGVRSDILLYFLGGVCRPMGGNYLTNRESIIVSAAGPAMNLALGLAAALTMMYTLDLPFGLVLKLPFSLMPNAGWMVLLVLIEVNIYWALINLLPILPLDGGQIFRAVMSDRNPALVPKVGMIVAIVAAVCGLLFWGSLFVTILFGMLAYENYQMIKGLGPRFRF